MRKNMHKKRINLLYLVAILATTPSALFAVNPIDKAQGRPLKIYILAGQSNMQGQAQPSTVPRMALSPETKALHDKILDKDGNPIEHKNVSIVYFTGGDISKGEERALVEKKGLLSTGFGSAIGPELGFGITMDEAVDQPILIIKTAWGGRSLFHHFRPPSAGVLKWEPPKKTNKPQTPEMLKAREESHYETHGLYYRLIVELVKGVLEDPGKYSEAYDPEQGYEIAGFGWFQGYNDMIAGRKDLYKASEDKPQFAAYTELLGHLIRDLRKDLNAPRMPVVIGIEGIGGEAPDKAFRKAMAATAELPDLKGTVVAVPTGRFWDKEVAAAENKVSEAEELWDTSADWTIVGKPAPQDRTWHYTSFTLDKEEQYEKTSRYSRDFTQETPAELEDWLKTDFDVSNWQKGPAPIVKGTPPKGKEESQVWSPWGDGNILLMKTTFTLERDDVSHFRLCLQSAGSFRAYLNGTLIKEYPWWSNTNIRKWDIDAKLVKQGGNELAFYGNVGKGKGRFNAVDLYLEGLPRDKAEALKKRQDEIAPPRTRALAKGKSNQRFHYLGSAYTYCLIGEAMAKALTSLETGN